MELLNAANNLINFMQQKYGIRTLDDYTCPFMRALASAVEKENRKATRPAAAVDELIEAYRAVVYEEACLHCGKGEAWTVKCPDGTYLCETWGDSDGQANAEEMAGALNCAYKQGYAAARAALTGEE